MIEHELVLAGLVLLHPVDIGCSVEDAGEHELVLGVAGDVFVLALLPEDAAGLAVPVVECVVTLVEQRVSLDLASVDDLVVRLALADDVALDLALCWSLRPRP
ncbi:MAG: hypothetical protein GY798_08075 [Hyphomicrobiales bacterium]|nr:hypothetical protein [Hyphomicrobiales bacterium]